MQEQTQLELPYSEEDGGALTLQGLPFVGQKTYDGNIARFNCWNKGQAVNAKRIIEFFDYLTIEKNLKPVTLMNYAFLSKLLLKPSLLTQDSLWPLMLFLRR